MSADHDESPPKVTEPSQRLAEIEAQLAAVNRIFRRVLDMDDRDTLDRAVLNGFRDAIAYAVKMQQREKETEDLLECVRGWRNSDTKRRSSLSATIRAVILGLFAAVAGALATRFVGK